MTKRKFHVAIVGAGLGGLAAAIGITRAGHRVTVIEQAKALSEIGAGIQVPPNSTRILERWGLLPKMEAVSVRPQNFIIRSYRDGQILSVQNTVPFCDITYGAPFLHIHRADYHTILVDEAIRLGVVVQLNSKVTSIDFNTPRVFIEDKPPFDADIIIGADGLKSVCRESMLGRPDPPQLTGDLAYRITVPAEEMKKDPLLKDLVDRPNINFWLGPDCHVVCYLLKGGDLYNVVLIAPDNLPEFVNIAKADLREMNDLFQNWDPRLKALLRLCRETQKWRLQNMSEMQNWSHSSGKFVLLGDSAHATLPYLAQGAALSIEDGAVLGALFEKIQHPKQLRDVLVIYEAIRKPRASRVVRESSRLGQRVLHLHDGPLQQERDRQMLEEEPFDEYPNVWADPVFQPWLFSYDAYQEVDRAWSRYLGGTFPGTTGMFRAKLLEDP